MGLKYEYVIFDFDGTVMDSGPGIMDCIRLTLQEHSMKVPEGEILRKFIGPPIKASFMKTFGIDSDLADELVATYRKKYVETDSIMNGVVYEGITALLAELSKAGAKTGIASVKREVMIVETLKRFKIDGYFDEVCGASDTVEFASKTDILNECLKRLNAQRDASIMIGDSDYDAVGAKNCGLDFVAALWGYGFDGADDARRFDCRFVADGVSDLRNFLLG